MPISSSGREGPCLGPYGFDYRHSLSRNGSAGQRPVYEERCVDPVDEWSQPRETQGVHKNHPRDVNREQPEVTVGFIPGSAEPGATSQNCGPCASPASCRTFVCSVLTCGLYRVCQRPTRAPDEEAPDKGEMVPLRTIEPGHKEADEGSDWPEDIHIAGVRVSRLVDNPPGLVTKPPLCSDKRPSPLPFIMHYDEWDDTEKDVDSLITKKLLELYSEYQIEELAKCTTDSVFLKKTNKINQLISDLAEEHKLDEQDAECRLVREIIRISTRKKKKTQPTRANRTLSDSGNETMRDSETLRDSDSLSFSNNNNYNVQISEETHSDRDARQMRWNSGGRKFDTIPSFEGNLTRSNLS
ncbi:keratinocyte differentiation factor 1 [Aplochiton taeniatus]